MRTAWKPRNNTVNARLGTAERKTPRRGVIPALPRKGSKEDRMVYVLDKDGKPLMPTERHGKVRHMLKDGRAKVVKQTPFTI